VQLSQIIKMNNELIIIELFLVTYIIFLVITIIFYFWYSWSDFNRSNILILITLM